MKALETIVFIGSLLNFLLGLFVYVKDPRKRINQLFGFFGFVTSIWGLANFMPFFQPIPFWLKSGYAFGGLVPFFALLWSLEICEKKINKNQKFLLICIALFFFIVAYLNDFIVANVKKVYVGGFEGEKGIFFIPYWVYMVGLLAYIIYLLTSSYLETKGLKKLQISYVLIGACLFIGTVILVDFILPLMGIYKFIPLDTPSSLFLVFFTALAITRYHLFGIEVILTEILVGVIGILLVVQIFMARSTLWRIINGIIFALFCVFGYLLIRGVFREIKRREEVEKISKAKTEFLSIASHQLRTPLSIIKGYLSMILEGSYGELPEKVKKPMENVFVSNERLIRLVNDILNVTKIETGEMEMNLEKTDLREIIKEVISELSIKAKEKNLYLKFEEPKEFPKILLDSEKIRQVILNLVDNAIRYTQKGGVTVKLQIANGRLQIVVSDTGEGLTKEEKEKLFERFSRGTAGTKFWTEGAGLGLYVARRFVEMHKGKIWAESEGKGKGSTFYVELPIK